MSKKPETLFRERVRPKLDAIPFSWWESIQQVALCGTPDILGCVHGRFVALELKKSITTPLEALQRLKANKIIKAGGLHFKLTPENAEEVLTELRSLECLR